MRRYLLCLAESLKEYIDGCRLIQKLRPRFWWWKLVQLPRQRRERVALRKRIAEKTRIARMDAGIAARGRV